MEEYKTFCEWEKDDNILVEHGICVYNTICDESQFFEDGDIKDNEYRYCPYCGKLIIEVVK
jgi:hypothetical protein